MILETAIPDSQKCLEGSQAQGLTQDKGPSLCDLVDVFFPEEEFTGAKDRNLTKEQEIFINKCLSGKIVFDPAFGKNGAYFVYTKLRLSFSFPEDISETQFDIIPSNLIRVDYYCMMTNSMDYYRISKKEVCEVIKGTHKEIKLLEHKK